MGNILEIFKDILDVNVLIWGSPFYVNYWPQLYYYVILKASENWYIEIMILYMKVMKRFYIWTFFIFTFFEK